MDQKLFASKPKSVGQWENNRELFAAAYSTAIIVKGTESISVGDGHSLNIAGDSESQVFIGAATPVANDGYFITAKHCVSGEASIPKYLVAFTFMGKRPRLVKRALRVVWQSTPKDNLDFAIVHAPVKPLTVLTLADHDSIKRKTRVASTGWSGLVQLGKLDPTRGNAGGIVLKTAGIGRAGGGSGSWRIVYHTCALAAGDSGGPLLNERGQLIGINSRTRHRPMDRFASWMGLNLARSRPLPDYTALAIAPPRPWLGEIIQLDRCEQAHGRNGKQHR